MEFVREVNNKEWDAIRWDEVIPDRGIKLSSEQSLKVIGDLYDVIRTCVCIEKLAPVLEQRKILSPEECRFFVSQNVFTADFETRKLNDLVMILKRVAKYPGGGCVRSLYLSLCDVYEQDDLASAQQHRHVASYLRKRVQALVNISEEDVGSMMENCVNGINESAVAFESAKAHLLARNLGIELKGSNVMSYKEVCKLWLNNNAGQCTLGQLVCALFKSELARLACGLRPTYDSNHPEFKSFIQATVRSQTEFKKVVKFFNFEREGRSIQRGFDGIIKSQENLLLRLLRIPNCGDEIVDIIACLRSCLKESRSQHTSGVNQPVHVNQQSQGQLVDISKASESENGLERDGVCRDASQSAQSKQGVVSKSSMLDDTKRALHGGAKQLVVAAKCLPPLVSSSDTVSGVKHSPSTQAQTVNATTRVVTNPPKLLSECMDGQWNFVYCILETEKDLDCLMVSLAEEDYEGKTALHHACMKEKIDCVKVMIEKAANLSHVDKSGNSVLHYPTVLKNEELLRLILDACDKGEISIDQPTKSDHLTPLMMACTLSEQESVRAAGILLDHGAAPDGHAKAHSRPIIVACEGGNLKLIKLLVTYAADINVQDKEGCTALLKACSESRWSGNVVKYLLGLTGINVNRSDKSGTTPLFAAVHINNGEITRLLLQKDARVNINRMITREPFNGQIQETPLALACALGVLEIVKMLVDAGADTNYKCSGNISALGFAILRRQNHIVSYLLTCPALDTSITGLSADICLSVKAGNRAGTRLLLDYFGGYENCLRLAEDNQLTDVQQHINEFIFTAGPETDLQENRHPFFEHRAKVNDVINLFTNFCMKIISKKMPFSQWAQVTEAEVSSFFKRCANGNERAEMLTADFLGACRGVSPLSFLIEQGALNTEDFLVEANAYFNNEPEVFYQSLIEAFHTIPGGENLPHNIKIALDRLFSGTFSFNCQIGTSVGQLPPYMREHVGDGDIPPLYRSKSYPSPFIPGPSHVPSPRQRSKYPAVIPADLQPVVMSDSPKVATPSHGSRSHIRQEQSVSPPARSISVETKSSNENVGRNINPRLHQYYAKSAAYENDGLLAQVQMSGGIVQPRKVDAPPAVSMQQDSEVESEPRHKVDVAAVEAQEAFADPSVEKRQGIQRPYVKVMKIDDMKKHLLGGGAHGSVEVVIDSKGNKYAAKRIHQVDENVLGQLKRIINEMEVLQKLHHKSIVRYIGLADLYPGELPVIVMELMHTNLHKCIVKNCPPGPLDYNGKIKVMLGVCFGLDFLHKNNVIHRDLTARNVLLDTHGNAKISDFGNCKILSTEQMSSMTANQGTLLYLAPECTQKTYNAMIDVFSYGHIALFVFIHRFPSDLLSHIGAVVNGRRTLRSEVERRQQYIVELEEVMKPNTIIASLVKECLADVPEERPFLDTIQRMLEEAQCTPPAREVLISDILSIDDLHRVKEATWEARVKWYDCGLALGVRCDTLDAISIRCHGDCNDSFRETLKEWLRSGDPPPTWSALFIALKCPSVGHGFLADKLSEQRSTL